MHACYMRYFLTDEWTNKVILGVRLKKTAVRDALPPNNQIILDNNIWMNGVIFYDVIDLNESQIFASLRHICNHLHHHYLE